MTDFAKEGGHCRNGGCKRPLFKTQFCFRCWAGVKWTSVRQRVENKNGNNPSYQGLPLGFSKEAFIAWILENQPPATMEEPSLDRIVPELGYVPGNIRWLEKRLNSSNVQRDFMERGERRCACCKEVFPATTEVFVRAAKSKSKLGSYCKPCWRKYTKAWAEKHKEAA